MISLAEVQRISGALGVAPTVIDHDYVIGCFLRFLCLQEEVRKSWLFKGGTSLQKCYFGIYRFSEDLDFTITDALTEEGLSSIANAAKTAMQDAIGISTDEFETRVESIEDDYGKESLEARIYYRGPHNYGGNPRLIQVQVSRGECISFATLEKPITHLYSDEQELPASLANTYSLEEMFAEKLRAFSGQRKRAIARDIFDLYYLDKKGADVDGAITAFPDKCKAKEINASSLSLDTALRRENDYRLNWDRNLEYLVPKELKIPFDTAWNLSIKFLEKALIR